VDQIEDGQDYRQQYITEDTTHNQDPNIETNGHQIDDVPETAEEVFPGDIAPEDLIEDIADDDINNVPIDTHSDSDVSNSKRPLDEVIDPSTEDQAPRTLLVSNKTNM
jgi:hypothetical protein